MKEIRTIIEAYKNTDLKKNNVALATVVRVEGSSYRRTGARMLISDAGEWVGGISGGCLEGDALKKAKLAIAQRKPTLVTYDTTDDDPYQIGVGLGCNGIIDVLLAPLNTQDPNNQVLLLEKCLDARSPNIVLTVTHLSGKWDELSLGDAFRYESSAQLSTIFHNHTFRTTLIEDVESCFKTQKSETKVYQTLEGTVQFFIEFIPPALHLVLHGGNYDIYPMVKLAKEVGWKVSVVCNPLKVHKSLFSTADAVIEKDKSSEIELDNYTVALLMAHDYNTDFDNLKYYLNTAIPYIGMLGPKKRTDKMFAKLAEDGNPVSVENLERIATPVGLDIGASTPEEIAISIIAEIKTFYTGRNGQRLTFRKGAIYEE
jgi:xanthine dehydrogenase accessory factor